MNDLPANATTLNRVASLACIVTGHCLDGVFAGDHNLVDYDDIDLLYAVTKVLGSWDIAAYSPHTENLQLGRTVGFKVVAAILSDDQSCVIGVNVDDQIHVLQICNPLDSTPLMWRYGVYRESVMTLPIEIGDVRDLLALLP